MVPPRGGITERSGDWQTALAALKKEPLAACSHFPAVAARWEAWWHRENQQPLIMAQVMSSATIRRDKAFDLIAIPEAWLGVRRRQLAETVFFGEAQVPLFIECPAAEVKELATALDPRGVAIRAHGVESPAQGADLVAWRDAQFG